MTLPQKISDAIDAYRFALWVGNGEECDNERAALERAIADHVAYRGAPTEAEIEAWEQRARDLLKSSGLRVRATLIREDGTPTGEELDSPPLAYVLMLREAVALMRRAADHVADRDALESQCDYYKADLDAIRAMLPAEEGVSTQDLMRRAAAATPAPSTAILHAARAVLFHGLTGNGTLVAGPQLLAKLLALKSAVGSHDVRSWERSEAAQFGEPAKNTSALERLREWVQSKIEGTLDDTDRDRARREWCAYRLVAHRIDEEREREAGHG
jgi:hypothetical protein